jgi:hypothetical protein
VTLSAWWNPGWYNTDQSLKVGQRETFWFYGSDLARPGYDLHFVNHGGFGWDYREATVESIEHARFGSVHEVDTRPFGQYTFRFTDGRWITIEAEEDPGTVNAASPGFPVDACDPEWANNSGWALVAVLSDVVEAESPSGDLLGRSVMQRVVEHFQAHSVRDDGQR